MYLHLSTFPSAVRVLPSVIEAWSDDYRSAKVKCGAIKSLKLYCYGVD